MGLFRDFIIEGFGMRNTGFQTSNYSHAQQTQILGTSGLKIFAGEDLSTLFLMQHMAIENGYNNCSPMPGGSSRWRKTKDAKTMRNCRKLCTMHKLWKSMSIENNWNNKKLPD